MVATESAAAAVSLMPGTALTLFLEHVAISIRCNLKQAGFVTESKGRGHFSRNGCDAIASCESSVTDPTTELSAQLRLQLVVSFDADDGSEFGRFELLALVTDAASSQGRSSLVSRDALVMRRLAFSRFSLLGADKADIVLQTAARFLDGYCQRLGEPSSVATLEELVPLLEERLRP